MRESRTLAWKVFSKPRKADDKNFAFYYKSSCDKEINYAISMLRIVDFFDRVSFLANNDYINKVLAQTIFHKAYKAWYEDCFKPQDELLNSNGGSDGNQDVKKTFRNIGDLTWLYNQSEKDWTTEILNSLLHKIFGKPMDIQTHEQTKLNEYINEFSSSLYRQLYNEDQPEKVKASTEIRKKIANDKQLQYTIDVSFPNPTEEGQ